MLEPDFDNVEVDVQVVSLDDYLQLREDPNFRSRLSDDGEVVGYAGTMPIAVATNDGFFFTAREAEAVRQLRLRVSSG